MNNKPIELTPQEWEEVFQHPAARQVWGLENETPEEFAAMAYAVKFNFVSGSPGYVGEIYILQEDVLTGFPPLVFKREDGKLVLLDNSEPHYRWTEDPDCQWTIVEKW